MCCALCSALGRQSHSLTRDTLFTLRALAAFCARPLHLKRPRFCLRWAIEREAVGGLRCCHREGHAPLMSEWVTQQPLPWRGKKKKGIKKMFQVDVWKVLSGLCFERRRDDEDDGRSVRFQKYLTSVLCVNVT